MPPLVAEAVASRHLTEAKILFYSGKRVKGCLQLLRLILRYPDIVLKRFMGRQMTDIGKYLISMGELKQLISNS